MVCLVVNNKFVHEKEFASYLLNIFQDIKTIIINYNFKNTNVVLGDSDRIIYGNGYINDRLCGLNFKISHKSFYQVNVLQAENLYNIAKKLLSLDKSKTLLDLYCGTGTIGLTMANEAKEVVGIDIVPQAIDDARENAKLNNIKNAKFYCGDSGDIIRKLRQNGFSPEAVVLDPPRKGCNDKTLDEIVNLQPENIAYISCNPATLSRDLKEFAGRGYHVKTLVPVDMFPRTPHVETVVLMSKVEK
jgi:23S rRNA (uracil1939-C5)-methyltransferase